MARRRRNHYHLLEALEPRSYLSVAPGGPTVAIGVNLADGTPTRLYRTPVLLQSKGTGGSLKANPASVQTAQTYFDVIMGYPPPTLDSGPTATFADPHETTAALSVAATSGSPDSKLTYTWAVQSGPNANAVTFSDNSDDTALNTIATFHAAGDYVFAVTVSDGIRLTTGTVGIHVDTIASNLVVVPGMTQGADGTLSPNGNSPFTAVVSDQFGQAMTAAITWSLDAGSIGTISSTGLYQAPAQSGSATIRATCGSLTNTLTVTVGNHAPTIVNAATAGSSTVTGTSATLSVLASDDGGEPGLTYTWSLSAQPTGSSVSFADNNDNSAKATTATFTKAGVYTFLVTITDGSLITTSSVTLTVAQKITTIGVVPTSSNLNINGSTALTATAYDQFGAALTVQPTFTWSKTGVGSVNAAGVFSAGGTSGGANITASAGGVSGSAAVTVANAAPTIATPASGPGTVTTTSAALSVLGADDGGEPGLTYTWALISGPAGVAFSSNGANASRNTSVTFTRAGNYSFQVTVSDGSLTTTSSLTLQVAQTISSIAVTPGSFALSLNQTRNLLATAYDQFGQQMTAQPSFTWSKAGVGSVDSSGVYTSGATAGVVTIQALAGGVAGTATATVGNTAPTVVTPASGPATVTTTNATLSVLGADDGGENNLTYTWSLTGSPTGGTASYSANGTNAAKSTVVTFNKAGTYTFLVTLSDGSLTTTSAVTLTVVQTLSSIVVTPGSASLNLNGTRSLSAAAYDQFGAAMAAQPTFTWSKAGGVGSVNAGGTYSAGTTAGSATITASAGGVSGSATMTVTNAAPTIATPAAGPATVTGTTATLTVLGADDAGESGLTYAWSLTSGPTGASPTFSANGANGAKSTVVTFNRAGSYTFLVTVSDGSLTTTSSVTLSVVQTISSISVSPGSASLHLNGTQALTATGYDQFGLGMSVQPTFTWTKTSGVGGVNAGGTYSAGTSAGSATITASAGGVSGSASMTVTNAAPTIATPASGPGTITGKTATLTVLGADDGGEAGLTYSWSLTSGPGGGTVSLSANGANGAKSTVVTFTKAGSYSFLVTVSDGSLTATSSVTVTVNQTLTTIGVSPSSSSLSANGSETLTATGYDQFGQALTVQPTFTWALAGGVGSVNSSGVYSAGATPGSATITASSGGIGGSATVTVANQAPTIATPASGPSTVGISSANLSVLGADDGGEGTLTYTWSIVTKPTGASPSFSINGTNAAKNTMVLFNRAGSYTFLVTVSDGSLTTTSSWTLTVTQTMTSIQVSPGTQSLNAYAVQQFSATAYDQFGQMLTAQPTFTWTVDSGGDGTVGSGGAFTAGGSSGTATVRATSGGLSGTAAVTVSATSGNAAVVTTRNLTSFTELVITGTSGNDTISVSESGNTFTIISNGITQTVTGTFGDMAIHAGSGGSTITVASSVTINTLVYGGAGSDTLNDFATGSYNAIVTIGGGTDTLTGNGVGTNYWADTGDTVNASAGEVSGGMVNKISAFYQPWTTDVNSSDYVPLQLAGQSLTLPLDAGNLYQPTASSFFGTGPSQSDINQRSISDCFLMADLAGVAWSAPTKLFHLAVDLGDGTYAVRFIRSGVSNYVRVDNRLSGGNSAIGASGNDWAVVIEKAYAYFRASQNGVSITYSSLNLGQSAPVFRDLGLTATTISVVAYPADTLASYFLSSLQSGAAITFNTPSTVSSGFVPDHVYSLDSLVKVNGTWLYTLRNPWGTGTPQSDGLITVSYADLTANFIAGVIAS
ncbi:MAG TPA: C2 family cysteine protease [Phycisphaerae bacterium]|nr:C2 family cysteine protease [Phycisphaerae bacterium]